LQLLFVLICEAVHDENVTVAGLVEEILEAVVRW
jgi:hypothetical protein